MHNDHDWSKMYFPLVLIYIKMIKSFYMFRGKTATTQNTIYIIITVISIYIMFPGKTATTHIAG